MSAVAAVDRLRDPRSIAAVLASRGQRGGTLAVVHARRRGGGGVRVAAVASRAVGSAVRRNRAKRLLREAARAVAWRDGLDVVLVARRACADSDATAVTREVRQLAEALAVTVPGALATPGAEG